MQARQAPQLNKSGCALHTYFVFKKINLVKSKTFNISISIDYIKTKKWLRRLCTVHFGFMCPFLFCPSVEGWTLLSFVFILSLFYCFIIIWAYQCFIWAYMGLIQKLSSYYLVSWATFFSFLFFPKFCTVTTVPSGTVTTIATVFFSFFFFSNRFIFFFSF